MKTVEEIVDLIKARASLYGKKAEEAYDAGNEDRYGRYRFGVEVLDVILWEILNEE